MSGILAKPANLPKVRFDAHGNLIVTRSRAAASRRAQESGSWGEERVKTLRDAAKARGVCRVDKVPTPTKNVGRGRLVYLERSTVDGVGFFFTTGRAIADEVKTVSSGSAFYTHNVETHQRAYLDLAHQSGALALLTLVFRGRDGFTARVFSCPWDRVRHADALVLDDSVRRRVAVAMVVAGWETDAEHYPYPKRVDF